jgi:hypothetical protein
MFNISIEAALALKEGTKYNKGNTWVIHEYPGNTRISKMYLHGNLIAMYLRNQENSELFLSNSGYLTPTTKRRLNAILDAFNYPFSIVQRQYDWYFHSVYQGQELYLPFFNDQLQPIGIIDRILTGYEFTHTGELGMWVGFVAYNKGYPQEL